MVIFPSFSSGADYTTYTTVQLPYPLEDRGHCPRAMALGSAFTAMQGDATCLYWNPAGLDGLALPEISLAHQVWYTDISQSTFLCAMPISKVGAFALGANYQGFGSLDGYDSNGDPLTSFRPYRASISIGQGMALSPAWSVGLSVREFSQTLIPGSRTASYSVCPGVLWRALPSLRLGAFYSFLNTNASWELGLFKVGASWSVPLIEKYPCLFLFDLSMPPHGVYQIQCGVEQELFSVFFIRLGFQQDLKDNQIEGFRGFTEGLGIRCMGFELDYGCALNGDLGCAQMVGLTYHFQPEKEADTPSQPVAEQREPLVFKPPSEVKPQDQAVTVEVQFQLPEPDTGPSSEVKVVPPEMQRALDEADKRVQKNPRDAGAWLALGKLYFQLGRSEYTIQCFEEALRIQPSNLQLKAWLEQYRRQLKKTAPKPE